MAYRVVGPFDQLNEKVLYEMLGDAWIAQLDVQSALRPQWFYLPSTREIGKREFDSLKTLLEEDNDRRGSGDAVLASVSATIQRAGTWHMPPMVVAALAVRMGEASKAQSVTALSPEPGLRLLAG